MKCDVGRGMYGSRALSALALAIAATSPCVLATGTVAAVEGRALPCESRWLPGRQDQYGDQRRHADCARIQMVSLRIICQE